MVGHQDEVDDFPPGTSDLSRQELEKSVSIVVLLDDVLAGIASRHDMVNGPLELESQPSGHGSASQKKTENGELLDRVASRFQAILMIRRTPDGLNRLMKTG